jgi:hypothetical protein
MFMMCSSVRNLLPRHGPRLWVFGTRGGLPGPPAYSLGMLDTATSITAHMKGMSVR